MTFSDLMNKKNKIPELLNAVPGFFLHFRYSSDDLKSSDEYLKQSFSFNIYEFHILFPRFPLIDDKFVHALY